MFYVFAIWYQVHATSIDHIMCACVRLLWFNIKYALASLLISSSSFVSHLASVCDFLFLPTSVCMAWWIVGKSPFDLSTNRWLAFHKLLWLECELRTSLIAAEKLHMSITIDFDNNRKPAQVVHLLLMLWPAASACHYKACQLTWLAHLWKL